MHEKKEFHLWIGIPAKALARAIHLAAKGHREWSGIDGDLECNVQVWKRRRVMLINVKYEDTEATLKVKLEPIGTTARRQGWDRWLALLLDKEYDLSVADNEDDESREAVIGMLDELFVQALWRITDSLESVEHDDALSVLEPLLRCLTTPWRWSHGRVAKGGE